MSNGCLLIPHITNVPSEISAHAARLSGDVKPLPSSDVVIATSRLSSAARADGYRRGANTARSVAV
jgi:hypothetical protein